MIVAALTVHWGHGLLSTSNGEVPLLYASGGLALALTGHGAYSLDALLGLQALWTPSVAWAAIGIGVVGGIANLLARRSPATA
jgi:putative oxidoreductase